MMLWLDIGRGVCDVCQVSGAAVLAYRGAVEGLVSEGSET